MAPTPQSAPDAARSPFGAGRVDRTPTSGRSPSRPAALPCPSRSPTATTGPGPDAPQVLVIHALTGSADAAGDWWAPLIGPGLAFDTDAVGVLCANLLGGNYGSTGPGVDRPVDRRGRGATPSPRSRPATRPGPCGRSPTRWASTAGPSSPAARWAG